MDLSSDKNIFLTINKKEKDMARIRLNQELRNKGGVRFRLHLEQEHTQEKEDFFQKRENFKALQDKTWDLLNYVSLDNIHKKMWTWHIIFKTNTTT